MPESKGTVKVDMLITACAGGVPTCRRSSPTSRRPDRTTSRAGAPSGRGRSRGPSHPSCAVPSLGGLRPRDHVARGRRAGRAASKKKVEHERVTKSNACKVLTRKQIEAVLGGEATSTGTRREGPDFECNWTVTATGAGRPAGTLRWGSASTSHRGLRRVCEQPRLRGRPGHRTSDAPLPAPDRAGSTSSRGGAS